MRKLYNYELKKLNNRGYTAYSDVKKTSNGREYILVKDRNGKRLGARFLSSLNGNMVSKNKEITDVQNVDNQKSSELNNEQIEVLGDITSLHDTILKLQADINGIESRYNLDNLPEPKRLDMDILTSKRKSLDDISQIFKNKVEASESIIPDKSTILDIINDIL